MNAPNETPGIACCERRGLVRSADRLRADLHGGSGVGGRIAGGRPTGVACDSCQRGGLRAHLR